MKHLMKICPFCRIVTGVGAAEVVHQSDRFICFLPLVQEAPGHTIIAPKAHHESLLDAPAELGTEFIEVCKHLAQHYLATLEAPAFNLLSANGAEAQQSVMHLHFHFIPRRRNDRIDAWPALPGVRPP